jgi:competence protein ComEA
MWKQSLAALAAAISLGASARVDINQATAADLDGIKGIGPGTSTRILEARQKGPFADWNDLIARVRGIGPASAARLSGEGVTVQGTPYPASPGKPGRTP